jgi:hypothetical protein
MLVTLLTKLRPKLRDLLLTAHHEVLILNIHLGNGFFLQSCQPTSLHLQCWLLEVIQPQNIVKAPVATFSAVVISV